MWRNFPKGRTYIYTYEGWEEFRDALELKINQLIKNTSITGNLNVAFFSKRQAAHYFSRFWVTLDQISILRVIPWKIINGIWPSINPYWRKKGRKLDLGQKPDESEFWYPMLVLPIEWSNVLAGEKRSTFACWLHEQLLRPFTSVLGRKMVSIPRSVFFRVTTFLKK